MSQSVDGSQMKIKYFGTYDSDKPTLIFGTSLGADSSMWRPQVKYFKDGWNTITFDLRGHGESPLSTEQPSIEIFADDVISIADDIGLKSFSYCGLSIGGAIGQVLGAKYPDRIDSLCLASTGTTILTPEALYERADRVLSDGMKWIAEQSVSRWFARHFIETQKSNVIEQMKHMLSMSPKGYAHACLALASFDGKKYIKEITAPTLVIAGDEDLATPPADNEELAEGIQNAEFNIIQGAAHLCNVEKPEHFNRTLITHLNKVSKQR